MRTADTVADLEQIEREYAAVIALLDRSAAFRHAAALVPGEIPDRTIDAMMRLARQTGLAIEVADHAREMADVAVHEERRHLALTIHDSVGALLFSIGAAARDLETQRECEPALRARLKYI